MCRLAARRASGDESERLACACSFVLMEPGGREDKAEPMCGISQTKRSMARTLRGRDDLWRWLECQGSAQFKPVQHQAREYRLHQSVGLSRGRQQARLFWRGEIRDTAAAPCTSSILVLKSGKQTTHSRTRSRLPACLTGQVKKLDKSQPAAAAR